MQRSCDACGLSYDDTYRLTFCPHEAFDMRTVAYRADGRFKVCTTVEELTDWVGGGCFYGDPTCPCQDGDVCHYEPAGETAAWPVIYAGPYVGQNRDAVRARLTPPE